MSDLPLPGKMLQLHIPNHQILYNSYMPFLEHGGLFVATDDAFSLGDEVLLALTMGNSPERKFLRTYVAWVNPARTSATRPKGIGVAFGSDEICITTKNQIEAQLGTALRSDRLTFTL